MCRKCVSASSLYTKKARLDLLAKTCNLFFRNLFYKLSTFLLVDDDKDLQKADANKILEMHSFG